MTTFFRMALGVALGLASVACEADDSAPGAPNFPASTVDSNRSPVGAAASGSTSASLDGGGKQDGGAKQDGGTKQDSGADAGGTGDGAALPGQSSDGSVDAAPPFASFDDAGLTLLDGGTLTPPGLTDAAPRDAAAEGGG